MTTPVRIWALSDQHLSHPDNRSVLDDFPAYPDDWLILAGDVTHGVRWLARCFERLAGRFTPRRIPTLWGSIGTGRC